jgi:hypothetical protein
MLTADTAMAMYPGIAYAPDSQCCKLRREQPSRWAASAWLSLSWARHALSWAAVIYFTSDSVM